MNLVLKKEKIYLRENWLKFLGIWGAAELFWGFGEHKQNTFRELRQKLTGIWGDQSIIFRELGSKDPPWGGLNYLYNHTAYYHVLQQVIAFLFLMSFRIDPLIQGKSCGLTLIFLCGIQSLAKLMSVLVKFEAYMLTS